jgi:catechol 2,3-dioxygenase-like lactoylglutathione lyase family enzyme
MAKLRHLAIKSRDPDASAEFFRKAFDFDEVGRTGSPGGQGRAIYLSDGTMNVAIFELNVSGLPNDEPEGLNHFGVVVEDLDETMALLEGLGAVCVQAPPEGDVPATFETKFVTPDGVGFDISTHGWPGISGVRS